MQMLRDKTEDVNEYHAEQAKVRERLSPISLAVFLHLERI